MVRCIGMALIATCLTGCAFVLDFDGFEVGSDGDAGTIDAATVDAGDGGVTDAPVPDGCVPMAEVCNGEDDDCNGAIDDLDTPPNEPDHCGACGLACGEGYECVDRRCTNEITDIAAGGAFTCARMRSGEVWCFGANDQGQVGIGTTSSTEASPQQLASLTATTRVGAGALHACALAAGGTWCWGDNDAGKLGDMTEMRRLSPVEASGGDGAVDVVAGESHSCLITSARGVRCAGDNSLGQLGQLDAVTSSPRFEPVATLTGVTRLAAGDNHSCAISGGRVQCWGDNSRGQLGMTTATDASFVPVAAALSVDAREIAAGGDHTCAIGMDGEVWCWGDNGSGQLGDGTRERRTPPGRVSDLPGSATAIAAGGSHTCAIVDNTTASEQQVYCWGANGSGQLGDMSREDNLIPGRVLGSESVRRATVIAAGEAHTCAAELDPALGGPSLRCWGLNTSGQLGQGAATPAESTVPLRVRFPAP